MPYALCEETKTFRRKANGRLGETHASMKTSDFLEFVRLVIAGDVYEVSRRLQADPGLATMTEPVGPTRLLRR